jgi:hypothetical protein
MRMVCTGHLDFVLGIQLVGVGRVQYIGPVFAWEQDCYRFGPCAVSRWVLPSKVSQAVAPTDAEQVFNRNARNAINDTTNVKV